MKNKLLFGLLFMVHTGHAIFTQAKVLQSKDGLTVFCFGDYHFPHWTNPKQAQQIRKLAQKKDALIIAENIFENDTNATEKLQALSHFKEEYSNVKNVEYRQISNKSFYGCRISAQQALQETDRIIEEVKKYDDGAILNTYYKNVIHQLEPLHAKIKSAFQQGNVPFWPRYTYLSIHDLLFDKNVQEALFDLLNTSLKLPHNKDIRGIHDFVFLYDSQLIDLRILHTIARAKKQKRKYICICAGQEHTKQIVKVLQTQLDFSLINNEQFYSYLRLDWINYIRTIDVEKFIADLHSPKYS